MIHNFPKNIFFMKVNETKDNSLLYLFNIFYFVLQYTSVDKISFLSPKTQQHHLH